MDMVCLRNICINTVHKGDSDNDDNNTSTNSPYMPCSSDVLLRLVNRKCMVSDPTL
jgi:hypothetical protein